MRLGIIGYGSIAAVHASVLQAMPRVTTSVWGPNRAKTVAFAVRHGLHASPNQRRLLEGLDGVVIASPSVLHVRQAAAAIRSRVATLVELPACGSASIAGRLGRLAVDYNTLLVGARTSLDLEPYGLVGQALLDGELGVVTRVSYERRIARRERSWPDDALRHHAQHPIDLLASWFGDLVPLACRLTRGRGTTTGVQAELGLSGGVVASIDIRYDSSATSSLLRVDGTHGWLETDGFTTIRRSDGQPERRWAAAETYRESVRRQDERFVEACAATASPGKVWGDTVRVAAIIDRLAVLASRADA